MKKRAVDDLVDAEPADAHALRALHAGTATAIQQKRALAWILQRACEVGGMQYWPTDRDTVFSLGRLFVGKQIGRLLICDLSSLRRPLNENQSPVPKP